MQKILSQCQLVPTTRRCFADAKTMERHQSHPNALFFWEMKQKKNYYFFDDNFNRLKEFSLEQVTNIPPEYEIRDKKRFILLHTKIPFNGIFTYYFCVDDTEPIYSGEIKINLRKYIRELSESEIEEVIKKIAMNCCRRQVYSGEISSCANEESEIKEILAAHGHGMELSVLSTMGFWNSHKKTSTVRAVMPDEKEFELRVNVSAETSSDDSSWSANLFSTLTSAGSTAELGSPINIGESYSSLADSFLDRFEV